MLGVTLVKIKQFVVPANAYVLARHCSACYLRRDQFDYGV